MATILVTGATDGIGRETARQLITLGARVLVHGRSQDKAARTVGELGGDAEPFGAELGSLDEVRGLAAAVRESQPALDAIVHNAGVFETERRVSRDGYELTMAVNHLAPFLLTHLLLPSLSAGGRVVVVSSIAHVRGAIDFDDLDRRHDYDGYDAYAGSKLMNVLFAFDLAARLRGRGIAVNAVHPGVVTTKLLRRGFGATGAGVGAGAAGLVRLAVDPAVDGVSGRYFDQTREGTAARAAYDRALQRRLYEVSVERTGVAPLPAAD